MYQHSSAASGALGLVYFLIILVCIICNIIIALKMCEVAELKGYDPSERSVFVLCFFFGIFGILYVIALPDLKLREIRFSNNDTGILQSREKSNDKEAYATKIMEDIKELGESGQKDEWLQNRIMSLISSGMSPSDAKIQAETEYAISKKKIDEEKAKQDAELERIEKFRNSTNFNYDDHLEAFESFSHASDLIEYLKKLGIKDKYFAENVLPKIEEYKELERLYGNMLKSALTKLKELTKK